MAIPTSATWNLVDFNETNLHGLLGLGPSDLSLTPGAFPYFQFFSSLPGVSGPAIRMRSDDAVLAEADFNVAVSNRVTIEMTLRFTEMPENVGDLENRRIGFTVSDDASRGVSVYFSKTGVAVSRIDDFGSVTSLPNTADFTSEVVTTFHTVRIAIDGSLGRAYVFINPESDAFPTLQFIVPIEETPLAVGDRLRLFAKGLATDTAALEFKTLRLASDLVISNFPPTANPGPDRVAPVGQAVRLDGRGSFDLEGAPLRYAWRAIDAPFNSDFAHDNSSGSSSDDGDGDGFTDRLDFAASTLDSWVAAGDVLVIAETRHVIATVDNPGGFLTVTTDTIVDSFAGQAFRVIRQSLLVDADTETPYAVPDIAGLYRAELIVNDGEVDSEPIELLISAVSARAPLGVEPDISPLIHVIGDDWKLVENKEVFEAFWKGTSQILAGKMLEAWQYHYNFNIGDAQRTFQRKWLPYRTLIAETASDDVSIAARHGILFSTHDFLAGLPAITGLTLVVEASTGSEDPSSTSEVTVTFTGDALATAITDINTALSSFGIEAVSVTESGSSRLALRSLTRAFKILSTSTAAVVLGFETDTFNYLSGSGGALVTDRTYRVNAGINLQEHGVSRGDILSINNGQAFVIDRVISDSGDPTPYQRVVVTEVLPLDATTEWEIPSVVVSEAVDYELEGSYPGDLVKVEVFDSTESVFVDVRGIVVAQREGTVAARFEEGLFGALRDTNRYELKLLGVKRRKAVSVDTAVLSIPRLQDLIPQDKSPTIWQENIDYYIEPFYRDLDDAPVAMLQFRDSTFITPDIEPPDILWAELTILSNDENIENTFGRLVGFTRDDAAGFGAADDTEFSYASAVAGLLYSHEQGPTLRAIQIGLNILFGQPFAEVKGTITEIRDDFTPTTGRILIQDDDGYDPPRTDVIRSYVYKKDPLDASSTSGLGTNPATQLPYAVGDTAEQFDPLGSGVEVLDYVNSSWFIPFVRSGILSEVEKFFRFVVSFNLDLVSVVNLSLISTFALRIKPTYTQPILLGLRAHEDDIDIVDVLSIPLTMDLVDCPNPSGKSYIYNDYRGDGTTWTAYGASVPGYLDSYYDEGIDCPEDAIELLLEIVWGGGIITYDSIFFYDVLVEDVLGAIGAPGSFFAPTYGMVLPASTYRVTATIDSGPTI
jgi:hypothetical protein